MQLDASELRKLIRRSSTQANEELITLIYALQFIPVEKIMEVKSFSLTWSWYDPIIHVEFK